MSLPAGHYRQSWVSLRCLGSGAHDTFDVLLLGLLGDPQIVFELEAEPEAGRCAQVPRRRNAVSAVMPRLPRTISLRRVAVMPSALARRFTLMSSGFRMSSRIVSPGWGGAIR